MAATAKSGDAVFGIGPRALEFALGGRVREASDGGIVADSHDGVGGEEFAGDNHAVLDLRIAGGLDAHSDIAVGATELLVVEMCADVIEEVVVFAEVYVADFQAASVLVYLREVRFRGLPHLYSNAENPDIGEFHGMSFGNESSEFVCHIHKDSCHCGRAVVPALSDLVDELARVDTTAVLQSVDIALLTWMPDVALFKLIVFYDCHFCESVGVKGLVLMVKEVVLMRGKRIVICLTLQSYKNPFT